MRYFGTFDALGFPTGFYEAGLNPAIPSSAVALTDGQWAELVQNPGQRTFLAGQIAAIPAASPVVGPTIAPVTRSTALGSRVVEVASGALAITTGNRVFSLPFIDNAGVPLVYTGNIVAVVPDGVALPDGFGAPAAYCIKDGIVSVLMPVPAIALGVKVSVALRFTLLTVDPANP